MFLVLWTKSLWLYTMLILGSGVLYALVSNWDTWPQPQKLVAMIYIILPFHVWEEWRFPGGFGFQYNWVTADSKTPDRYPMDQLSDMITVFVFMLTGITQLIYGATPSILITHTIFAAAEVGAHCYFGIKMKQRLASRGKRTIYNPGLATALLCFLPVFIACISTLSQMSLTFKDFLGAAVLEILFFIIVFGPERVKRERSPDFAFLPGYYKDFLESP